MMDWYKSGTPQQKTFWACYSGWALDSFDMQMFSFLLPALTAAWGLGKAEVGVLGTVALVVTAIGGWGAGILADRYGGARIPVFAIVWFTFFGVLAGFAQTYNQLLVARTLQGLGFGGEWAVGAALMAEVIDPRHRGRAWATCNPASPWAGRWRWWWPPRCWPAAARHGVAHGLLVRRDPRVDRALHPPPYPRLGHVRARPPQPRAARFAGLGVQPPVRPLADPRQRAGDRPAGRLLRHPGVAALAAGAAPVAASSMIVTVFIMAFGSFCGFAVAADRPTASAAGPR